MLVQWEAMQVGLRVFLEEDGDYVHFLESVDQELTRKLRFERRSRGGYLVDNVAFDRFVETVAQLRPLHVLFQDKLKPYTDAPARGDGSLLDGKCGSFVGVLADMLSVVRILYGQLFCRSEATQTVLDQALDQKDEAWDAKVLDRFLERRQMTAEELVGRPLKRFDELVGFVEALSKTLSEDNEDGSLSSSSESGAVEKLNYAQLLRIVQENKHFIHLTKADAREEADLIALQSCFTGDGAAALSDLSGNKLLLQGDGFMSILSDCSADTSETPARTGTFDQTAKIYAHCFEDGSLVCSKRQDAESGASFKILHRLQLKQDAAFLESVPANVPVLKASEDSRALALILQDATLLLAWNNATECQRWTDAIGGFLEVNGPRSEVLHQRRTIADLPVPVEVTSKLAEKDSVPTDFASFYDDHLPGVFWMAPGSTSSSCKSEWGLVEIVFYARWLIVFKLDGWQGHSCLCHFDTQAPEMEIGEQPRGDKEWSLVVSNGPADTLTLVSKKRTRIDFWFDQVSKAVESAQIAARRLERERKERQEMEEEETHTRGNGNKGSGMAGKKRKLQVVSERGEASAVVEEKEKSSSNSSPVASSGSKPDDKTDEECGEADKRSTAVSVEEEETTTLPARKKFRRSADKSKHSSAPASDDGDNTIATIVSLPLKTPKRRWLKRKSEDPNDTALMATQPSPSLPTDEATSEIDATQLPANEEAAEDEPKAQEVRIILTGIEATAATRKKISSIAGACYEEDVEKATHILAPKNQLKRTVKLLCGISRCAHVLDERWLDESARVGAPIYERAHCLKDAKAESKWHFDLRKTMYDYTPEQRQQLFAGHQVFITNHKSVLPPVKDLAKIVECAGGSAVIKGAAGPNDVVITSEAALATASVRKALAQANPQRIYSAELVLSSILQQHIDFNKNRLELASSSGGRHRR